MLDSFEYISEFFNNSLAELEKRHDDLKSMYRKLDNDRFICIIYRNGKAIAKCKIILGGLFGPGISFSYSAEPTDNSINQSLTIEHDDQGFYFKGMGLGSQRQGDMRLTTESASEHLWSLLIEPLQR